MTLTRNTVIQLLTVIQNRSRNWNRDIMTIVGCGMTDAELGAHVIGEFKKLSDADRNEVFESMARLKAAQISALAA